MTYDTIIGVDVGKYHHWAHVITPDGTTIYSGTVKQSEQDLRGLFATYHTKDQRTLVVVDQPNNIGKLTVAVADDMGLDVRYLTCTAMRNAARLYGHTTKTDAIDAAVIAKVAAAMPTTLLPTQHGDDVYAQLKILGRPRR